MKILYFKYQRRAVCPVIMMALLCIAFLTGCHKRVDPILSTADSKMEEQPDSTLMILESYTLSSNSPDFDRAYYGLLLTHARYKNFIDETNDSLISSSTDYFIGHGNKKLASRALFLQGVIRMNANRLGEAAVSFSKGIDIAREAKSYMWEGQCARAMYKLYGELHNGSAQVEYAKDAYDAFMQLGDDGWISTSKYALAVAYNNNFKYEEALSILSQLEKDKVFSDDSVPLSHMYSLKGLSSFALGRYEESLDSYKKAYALNPSVLTEEDRTNIQFVLSKYSDEGTAVFNDLSVYGYGMRETSKDAYTIYAQDGKYKEAYESIVAYKNRQDSILSVIISNDVSESLDSYRAAQETLSRKSAIAERMSYWLVILLVLVVAIACVWIIRERMHRVEAARLKSEADMESLRADLLSQLESTKKELEKTSKDSVMEKTIGFERIIRQRYSEANKLCDEYYQVCGARNKEGSEIHTEISSIIQEFQDKESLQKIAEYVDEKSGGLYSSFKKDFFNLPADCHRLFLYLILGFSSRTLSVIFSQNLNTVYINKSRLKAKIEKSDVAAKNEYLRFFSK